MEDSYTINKFAQLQEQMQGIADLLSELILEVAELKDQQEEATSKMDELNYTIAQLEPTRLDPEEYQARTRY